MADGTSDAAEPTLEEPAASWVADRADELGVSPDAFLERVVAAYRAAEGGDVDVVTSDELDERLAAVEADFESELADVDSEFDEKIQDVRERVIQVKRDADAKAAADHDHPELASRAEEAADLADDVAALRGRVDAGFENFEEVLTYLRDEAADLDRKTATLATAVVSMRDSVASLAAAEARRRRADHLKQAANRAGVGEADCGECGESVRVALLTAPECPYCAATFEDVDANPGWFSAHELVVGSAPALPADESDLDEESWLGTDGDALEAMAADDGGDDGPTVVEPDVVAADEPLDGDEHPGGDGERDEPGGGRDE